MSINLYLYQKGRTKNQHIYTCIARKAVAIRVYDTLRDEFAKHNKTIKIYHGGLNKKDKKIVNVDKEWIYADLVITTLTITVGIDFTAAILPRSVSCFISKLFRQTNGILWS